MVSWAVDAYLAAGEPSPGPGPSGVELTSLRDAMRLCQGGPALLRLKGHLAGARHAARTGQRRDLLAHARSGLADLARHRAALTSTELRALASGHGAELGVHALRALVREGSPAELLLAMERTRAAALLVTEAPQVAGIDLLLSELRAVQSEVAAARSDTGSEPADLAARQRAIEGRIRYATWTSGSSGLAAGRLPSLAELRRLLDGTPLVEYAAVDGDLVAVVVHGRRSRLVRLGRLEDVVVQGDLLTFALRHLAGGARRRDVAVAMRASALANVARLRDLLLAPLDLPADEPHVIVPSTATWRLPWAYLCAAPVAVAPSAASWARTVLRRPADAGRVVLVGGPHLQWADDEVRGIADVHGTCDVLVPPASTVEAVVPALRQASLAHLACHTRLRADNPTFSSFVLSAGELTVHELEVGDVSPHRVVLSACDSGVDASYGGNELVGFVSALLGRGTAGLLASCVQVSDAEAVPLMLRVHERLVRGATSAEALHAAGASLDPERPETLAAVCSFSAYGAA